MFLINNNILQVNNFNFKCKSLDAKECIQMLDFDYVLKNDPILAQPNPLTFSAIIFLYQTDAHFITYLKKNLFATKNMKIIKEIFLALSFFFLEQKAAQLKNAVTFIAYLNKYFSRGCKSLVTKIFFSYHISISYRTLL
ncbi:hypothetical protein BpHYR1_009936 [Brachionus plicatilis]|uniref:Uncharacterized protein n=1 Tax=Brachionus plicatilis TaxID=10195 RepID=A0A3M7RT49_BRAPC|nr:hypothetical protein BpHYR1_009936 [Brachionus plicatilis]